MNSFLGPMCCGADKRFLTYTNFSRSCLNPLAYNPTAIHQGKTCDVFYQQLSKPGKRFEKIMWESVNFTDFLNLGSILYAGENVAVVSPLIPMYKICIVVIFSREYFYVGIHSVIG